MMSDRTLIAILIVLFSAMMGCSKPETRWVAVDPQLEAQTKQSVPGATTADDQPAFSTHEATVVGGNGDNVSAQIALDRIGTDDYRIGPQDLLEIEVFNVEELSRKVRVNSRGEITLPLIGGVRAAGLTSQELEQQIAQLLAKDYLQDPHVSIFIDEYTSQRVTVEGAVRRPGIFPLEGQTTLLQAIALAEGLGDMADPNDVVVFRSQPGGRKLAMGFSLNNIRDGEAPDPLLQGDDIVVVDTSTGRSIVTGVANTLRGFVAPFIIPY